MLIYDFLEYNHYSLPVNCEVTNSQNQHLITNSENFIEICLNAVHLLMCLYDYFTQLKH